VKQKYGIQGDVLTVAREMFLFFFFFLVDLLFTVE